MRRFPEILTIVLCLALFAVLTACGPKGEPLTAEQAVTKVQALIAKPEALGVLNYDAPEVEQITENVVSNSIIQDVLAYINSHYTQPLKNDELAKAFGVSVSYLSHEFARFTNRSVYEYILYRRVMLARQLMQGEATLNDIAYQCGFNDYSNFLRIFNKMVGVSPSAYRKQLKQSREST